MDDNMGTVFPDCFQRKEESRLAKDMVATSLKKYTDVAIALHLVLYLGHF